MFFNRAAFYAGTCLRIFYGLPRFSEDLDFSNPVFDSSSRVAPDPKELNVLNASPFPVKTSLFLLPICWLLLLSEDTFLAH
nr:nucleotidyl transferase AbiEii/AbiGii toxin family protein [Pelodictyon phaeoclathratiforme]